MASEWLRQERPAEEIALVVEQVTSGRGDDGQIVYQTRLLARLAPREETTSNDETKVLVAQLTNVRKVAVFVARSLVEGGTKMPALRAMGPLAVSQALKAASVAREFVSSTDKELGGQGPSAG